MASEQRTQVKLPEEAARVGQVWCFTTCNLSRSKLYKLSPVHERFRKGKTAIATQRDSGDNQGKGRGERAGMDVHSPLNSASGAAAPAGKTAV